MSLVPEYAQYIKPFIGWAPSVYLGEAKSLLVGPLKLIEPLLTKNPWKFLLTEQWINDVGTSLCQDFIIGQPQGLCAAAIEAIAGDSNSFNKSRVQVYMNFFPKPASNWQMAHFTQLMKTGRFAKFDYGDPIKNYLIYNDTKPPNYPLESISPDLNAIIMYGSSDTLVPPEGIQLLISELKERGVNVIDIPISNGEEELWSHFDFVAGQGAGRLVYDKTIDYLDQYTVWDGPQ